MAAKKKTAKKSTATAAERGWAAMDNLVGSDADEHRDEGDTRTYVEGGKPVAVLTRAGDELVLDFEAPPMDEFEKVKRFYKASPARKGWLRYRRPATNDPRPDLEADLGSILGAAWRARHPPPKFRSIASGGGPYVCMHLANVPEWGGCVDERELPEEAALYEKALRGPDTASLLTLGNGDWALVLGTPDPLYGRTVGDTGLFARAVSSSLEDEALEKLLEKAPKSGWERIGKVKVKEPVRAFDVATFGGAIADGNSVTLALTPGTYEIACRTWQPDDETELLLTRLSRA